jgi:hypothetical protein
VRAVPVVLGEKSAQGTVLVEGPMPGTKLVKDPPDTLQDGHAVKEKENPR